MTPLEPGVVFDTNTAEIIHEPVPETAGTTTGALELGTIGGVEAGLWEMSAGEMHDTEVDEVCLIISGRATVEFLEPALAPVMLEAGSMLPLSAGMRTRWQVHTPQLRKLYLLGQAH